MAAPMLRNAYKNRGRGMMARARAALSSGLPSGLASGLLLAVPAALFAVPVAAQGPAIPPAAIPGSTPSASDFGTAGAGQVAPGIQGPAFVPRTTGDDPAIENSAVAGFGAVLGRFYASAGLNTLYDSNILRLGDTQVLRPGQVRADVRLTPQIDVGTNLPFGQQRFFANASFGRDFYLENTRLDRNRYKLSGGLGWRLFGRCAGTVDAGFTSQQSLLAELSEFVPNVQQTLSYGAVAECRSAGGLSIGGSVRRLETSNDNPTRSPFNNNSLSFGPQVSFRRPTLGTFSLSATWTKAEYPNRAVLVPTGTIARERVDFFQGRFGYARRFGSRLGIDGGIAVYRVTPLPAEILLQPDPTLPLLFLLRREGNTTLGFDASIDYRPSPRLTVQAAGSLTNNVSLNVGALSQRRQQYALDLGYRLGRAITLGSAVSYVVTDFRGSFSTPDEPIARLQDKLFRVVGSIDYQPVSLYSIGLEVAHQRRESDPAIYSFNSTSVRLRLRVNYGKRG
jgi:hypothetical protein